MKRRKKIATDMNATHITATNSIWLDDKRDFYSIYSYRRELKKSFMVEIILNIPKQKKEQKSWTCVLCNGIYYTFRWTNDVQESTWKWKYAFRGEIFQNILVFLCLLRNNNNHCHFDSCLVIWMLDYAKVLTIFYSIGTILPEKN